MIADLFTTPVGELTIPEILLAGFVVAIALIILVATVSIVVDSLLRR